MPPGTATPFHERFSRSLGHIRHRRNGNLMANRVLAGTEGRGLYLVWFGYLAALAATAYCAIFGALIVNYLGGWLRAGLQWPEIGP